MHTVGRPLFQRRSAFRWYSLRKNISGVNDSRDGNFSNFDGMISFYVRQARNSVLIRAPFHLPNQRVDDLLKSVAKGSSAGSIRCYRNNACDGKEYYYYLCELGRSKIDSLTSKLCHGKYSGLPVRMRMWKMSPGLSNFQVAATADVYDDEVSSSDLPSALSKTNSLDEQMNVLVNETALKPTGVAMRFFTASLMEDLFCGIFPVASCLPFGSTINGLGKRGGDLDMSIDFENSLAAKHNQDYLSKQLSIAHRTFSESNERILVQKTLDIYATLLANMVPFCTDVQRILHARVPIVKFKLSCCNLSCDLTTYNRTGIEMAKILWLYCQLDRRTKPLIFTVRLWAKAAGLTHSGPGASLTNFQITCLVVFFMQNVGLRASRNQSNEPTLPGIDVLKSLAGPSDLYGLVSEPAKVLYYQWRDRRAIKQQSGGAGSLLHDFFEFYSSFDFTSYALCLNTGRYVEKMSNDAPMYIINPLETSFNISKNVNNKNVQKFVRCCSQSLSIIKATSVQDSSDNPRISGVLPQLLNIYEFKSTTPSDKSIFTRDDGDRKNKEHLTKGENYVGQSKFVLTDLLREEFDDLDVLGEKIARK